MYLSTLPFNKHIHLKAILGISSYYHDSAAVLVVDGKIVAALQEERLNRSKNTSVFPSMAVKYCMEEGNLVLDDLDAVVFYDKPFLKFERLLENYYAVVPRGAASFIKFLPEWSQKKIFLKKEIKKELKAVFPKSKKPIRLLFSSHHLSHAASAFYPSPYAESAILTIDAVGEWATASLGYGKDGEINVLKEMHFPDSVGLLYSSFTYFLGFKVNEGEYKLMGLSPYGNRESNRTKEFVEKIKSELVTIHTDGSIRLNQSYFKYRHALRMIQEKKWEQLFGCSRRQLDAELEQVHADLALAVQLVTEEIVLKMAKTVKEMTHSSNLCLAGGVALNCVANGKLIESGLFENVWVQPAAGDAGGALGAALAVYHPYSPNARAFQESERDSMNGAMLGPKISEAEIKEFVKDKQLSPRKFETREELHNHIAQKLYENQIVGWVRGRLEFGPRALGARSILASPIAADMQSKLNRAVKFREDFRPFAPMMLQEEAERFYGVTFPANYMQFVHKVKAEYRKELPKNYDELSLKEKLKVPKSAFPAVTHVDFSSRIQTVDNENYEFVNLLKEFKSFSDIGMLVNTSFNRSGEPIVCSLNDAYDCFINTDLSILVVENYVFEKKSIHD